MQNRSAKSCSGALSLLVLTVYLLLVVPALSHTESMELGKEELQLRDLEPRLEADSGVVNEHGTVPSLIRCSSNRRNQRSIGFVPEIFQISHSKLPMELGILVDSEDGGRQKRYYDYGHMRFGKRSGDERVNDYGHMRFGR